MGLERTDWRIVWEQFGSRLLLFARQFAPCPHDAEDLVQETFIRYWNIAKKNPGTTPELMFTLLRRLAIDQARRKQRRERREILAVEWLQDGPPAFSSALEDLEKWSAVEPELAQLPPAQKEVLVLKVWGEMTFEQIGRILEISPNTAASRYRYAMEQLRKKLAAPVL
jgi:RNA polymerase sigma-70 factor, ECF subfamily